MFCVVCGKETDEELRGGVCSACYLEKNALAEVRDTVDVEVCVHCHARKRGEVWLEGHERLEPVVEQAVRDAVVFQKGVDATHLRVDVIAEDERNFAVTIRATGLAEGIPFEKVLTTRSRVKNATCVRCSRVQGGYYESIVQVRATKRGLEAAELQAIRRLASRFIERIVAEGDRNAFVLRDEEMDKGLDVYVGTTNAGRMMAKAIATEFGGRITEHAKTVGQKDGLDVVRMTFAVRLPEYRTGDVVVLGEEPHQVTSIGAKTVQAQDLRTGRLRHVERADVDRAAVLPATGAREAVIVSRRARELQVLDPWTYATVTVLLPEGLEPDGDAVPVIRYDGELFPLRARGEE